MTFRRRLRVVVPGGIVVAIGALAATWLSVSSFFVSSTTKDISMFALAVLSGPLFLLTEWAKDGYASSAATTLALAIAAIVLPPAHPVFVRAWAAVVTTVGLIAWLLCALIVAGAPA